VDDISFAWESDWLVAMLQGDRLEPGGSGWIAWRVDTRNLVPGSYHTGWSVVGNAPHHRRISGKVSLLVRPLQSTVIGLQQGTGDPDVREFVIRWHSETGRVYSLFKSADLRSDHWQGVPGYTNLAGGGEMSYTGRINTLQHQFYRVVESEP